MGGEITEIIGILNHLPTGYKVLFIFMFFALPKLIQALGGPKAFSVIIRRYQARKARQAEDASLTEAYTRTLVVESLGMFSSRLSRMDHKINHLIYLLDREANIEVIESTHPERRHTETIVHHKLHRKLAEIRKRNQARD